MIGGKILILKALLQQSVSLRGSSSLEIKPSNHPHWKQAEGLQNLRGWGGVGGGGGGLCDHRQDLNAIHGCVLP